MGSIFSLGCEKTPPPEFRFNSVHWLSQEKTTLSDDETFDPKYKKEIGDALTALFGTPDDPRFPPLDGEGEPTDGVINLENLKMAAGAVSSERGGEPHGLYREHCSHCHGITGDGAGPTASVLNPYPRDFRLGKFKYKSTPLGKPPTDEDLTMILRHGIPGTAMPSFQTLPPKEIEALVDYVKYLTMRGQTERLLIAEVSTLEGDPLLDVTLLRGPDPEPAVDDAKADPKEGSTKTSFIKEPQDSEGPEESEESDASNETETAGQTSDDSKDAEKNQKPKYVPSEDDLEEFEEQLAFIIEDIFSDSVLSKWAKADKSVTVVPPAPPAFDASHSDHIDFVAKGRDLFFGPGGCLQCHGETGVGDGETGNYDAWTQDWTNTPGVDLTDANSYQDFLANGVFPPRTISPRNLRIPVYRGGGHPDDIYRRVANGIEGTPMPSALMPPEDLWAIVAYVQSLPYEKNPEPLPSMKLNEQPVR